MDRKWAGVMCSRDLWTICLLSRPFLFGRRGIAWCWTPSATCRRLFPFFHDMMTFTVVWIMILPEIIRWWRWKKNMAAVYMTFHRNMPVIRIWMNICAVSDETYDCWKDYVKGELNVIFEYKTTKSFSILVFIFRFIFVTDYQLNICLYERIVDSNTRCICRIFYRCCASDWKEINKAAGTRARKASLELEKLDEGVPQALSGRVQKIISSFLIIFTCSCGISVCDKSLAAISWYFFDSTTKTDISNRLGL